MTATAPTDIAFAGPAALAAMVRAGQTSARELVELYLRRIEALDPQLNAFRVLRAEQALAEADQVQIGPDPLPLAGVPIAVKDDIDLAGEVATRGSRSFGPPASVDAEPIRRLRAAGAIPIGVTNVPELMIFPWTATTANGVTRNPWDPARTTGGSSGGSAAAVAAGLVAAATASDGGGSIRIPAAACGLVGMKPTRGRVPSGGGWLGLSTYGALARTVADSALLLDVMHGPAPTDPHQAPAFSGSYADAAATPPPRLRIALSRKLPPGLVGRVSGDQRGAWERTGALLSALGHDVVPRDPAYRMAQLEFVQTWLRGIYEESLRVPDRTMMERSTRQMAAMGRYLVPPRRREAILAARTRTTARITALWEEFDVLLLPALAKTAIAAEGGYGKSAVAAVDISGRFAPFTPVFNITGQPAISIPAGIAADGLPLAVQLVGRVGAEDTLYSLAAQIEEAAPWAQRRPTVS
ncbi:MAG TPA: amidase family protein [Solirubrobacteraceae bacterium]